KVSWETNHGGEHDAKVKIKETHNPQPMEEKLKSEDAASPNGLDSENCGRTRGITGHGPRHQPEDWNNDVKRKVKKRSVPDDDSDAHARKLIEMENLPPEMIPTNPDEAAKINALIKDHKSSKLIKVVDKIKNGFGLFKSKKVIASPDLIAKAAGDKLSKSPNSHIPKKTTKTTTQFNKGLQRVNTVLLGKNLIRSAVAGDVAGMTLMGGLMAGDKIFEKVGDKITSAGAKRGATLLGKSLKVAGPIIGQVTQSYSIYQLVNSISTLQSVDARSSSPDLFQESFDRNWKLDRGIAITNVVENSLDVATGAILTGALVVVAFTGPLAVPLAPILIGLSVITSIASSIATTVLEVEKIDNSIKLTNGERWGTGWRLFWGAGPPSHIKKLMEQQAALENLVRDMVEFLKTNQQFQGMVSPSIKQVCRQEPPKVSKASCITAGIFSFGLTYTSKEFREDCSGKEVCVYEEFYQNSDVDLRDKTTVDLDRAEPRAISTGDYLCKPLGGNGGQRVYSYRCKAAVGVHFPERSGQPMLFNLRHGSDNAYGFPYDPNVFIVESGNKYYKGGHYDDTFILQSGAVYGVLDGAGGINTLIIAKSYYPNQVADIKLDCASCSLKIQNVQKVLGRTSEPDSVTVHCKTTDIDLQGGPNSSNRDIIKIPGESCSYSIILRLGSHTLVENWALNGVFIYEIFLGVNNVDVNIQGGGKSLQKHQFQFPYLRTMRFVRKSSRLEVSSSGKKILGTTWFEGIELILSNGIQVVFVPDLNEFVSVSEMTGPQIFKGLLFNPNVIRLNMGMLEGEGHFEGGNYDDTFIILAGPVLGTLDGGGGKNTLYVDATYLAKQLVE
ncbi:unnamed protein product, partial [Allacma fusca]